LTSAGEAEAGDHDKSFDSASEEQEADSAADFGDTSSCADESDVGEKPPRRSTWDGYHTDLSTRTAANPAQQSFLKAKAFTRLQAILTDLPKHALSAKEAQLFHCECCSAPGGTPQDALTCAGTIEVALTQSCLKYPAFQRELACLQVVHATPDITILVDHEGKRLFTSIRGTNVATARDIGNDVLVVLGCNTVRSSYIEETYTEVRKNYPTYKSYGCGHSLGGTIMHELACTVENDPELVFQRVDVFNAGGSPFKRGFKELVHTEFNAHRTGGDLVSFFYRPPGSGITRGGRVIQHPTDPRYHAHRLGHFLPPRRTTMQAIVEDFGASSWLSYIFTCTSRRTLKH
jgi:hypothetical protein